MYMYLFPIVICVSSSNYPNSHSYNTPKNHEYSPSHQEYISPFPLQIILTTYQVQNQEHHMYVIEKLTHGTNAIRQFHNSCLDGSFPFLRLQDNFLGFVRNARVRNPHIAPYLLKYASAGTIPNRFAQIILNVFNQAKKS